MKAINETKIRLDRAVPNPLAPAVPDHMVMLPAVFSLVAKRNGGKTTVVSSMLRDYQDAGLAHRVFLISPNAKSAVNKALFEGLVADEDCYTAPTWASFNDVLRKIDLEGEEWRQYQAEKAEYDKFIELIHRGGEIPIMTLEHAESMGWLDAEPQYKYGNDVTWPSLHVVCDDCLNSALFAASYNNPVSNAAIRNRHIGGIGASLWFAVQAYSAQNGLSRGIRENTTAMLLWRMASRERRKQIAVELSSDLDMDQFLKVYEAATPPDDEHAFMLLDFQAPRERRFRAGLNRVITPEPARPARPPAE